MGGLEAEALTMDKSSSMISNDAIASFTIEASKTLNTRGLRGGFLDNEAKINGDPLAIDSSSLGAGDALNRFIKLGMLTGRTGL